MSSYSKNQQHQQQVLYRALERKVETVGTLKMHMCLRRKQKLNPYSNKQHKQPPQKLLSSSYILSIVPIPRYLYILITIFHWYFLRCIHTYIQESIDISSTLYKDYKKDDRHLLVFMLEGLITSIVNACLWIDRNMNIK